MQPELEYVTKREAAEMLGVCLATVGNWIRQGRLIPAEYRPGPRQSGRPPVFFQRRHIEEVQEIVAAGNSPAKVYEFALRALATARATEVRVSEIYDALGLGISPLPRDPAAICSLYRDSLRTLHEKQLSSVPWVRFWASSLFGMEMNYFELAGSAVGDPDIWLHYAIFVSGVEAQAQEWLPHKLGQGKLLSQAYVYLGAARRHLLYSAFTYCVQKYSLPVALARLGGKHDVVHELSQYVD